MDYQKKYLKYKQKYSDLKIKLYGKGHNNDESCPLCLDNFPKLVITPNLTEADMTLTHLNNILDDNGGAFIETLCCHNVFHTNCIV